MAERKGWDRVRYIQKYIKFEIDPVKLLHVLQEADILTQTDCESITATLKLKGESHTTQTELLPRLSKRGDKAFPTFVAALRRTGHDHAAQLLDPTYQVTAPISKKNRDERVLEVGVAADIRVKICLSGPTDEQVKEKVEKFCERHRKSHSDDAVKLRRHFNDFLDEDITKYVNLVKTTSSDETPLIFIFRFSILDAANKFWKDFNEGNLKSSIKTKLQSFSDELNNCFTDETIQFDIVIDPDDFEKVHHTLQNPEECKMLVDGMEKQELKLREYQDELVKPALKGMNTIICAPTGSGKTFVAMEAIKNHVIKPDRKYVVFIVNTVSLVEQQETRLQQYLPEPVEVSSVCGSNPDVSLPSVLKENHVVVVTAQVLLNALKKEQASEEGVPNEKHVSISQFSLLVFDECHHTTKEHPYNEIMRWYMTEKYEVPSPNLPQIIGLSASLGIGTGNSGSGCKAENHIMGLCANLDIQELMVYTGVQSTNTKITPISRDENNVFKKTISDIMTKIESMMLSVDRPVHSHGSQPYENWVVTLSQKDLGRDILTCLEQLNVYNNSLMINDEIRSKDALRYLRENIIDSQLSTTTDSNEKSTTMEIELRKLFDSAVAAIENEVTEPNPGLKMLEERLHHKLSHGKESKGIIFVRTRFVAEALIDWLRNVSALKDLVKNPTSVVGCGQRNGRVGMPKAKQDNEIKSFRDGDCNVIVATSVLLEGIDIPKCNFAINYGMPGNEITLMQARGRVRANQSGDWQYNIIVSRDQVMSKERDLQKEKLMKETIEKVTTKSKEAFKKKVEDLQRKTHDEYARNIAKRGLSQNSPVTDDIEFHCKKCKVFACKAKHIKIYHGTCHIVPNYKDNLHNVIFKDNVDDSKYMPGGFNKTGKTHCKKCGQDWGNRARNEYGEFPLIKIFSFRVKSSSGISEVYKQWNKFPYELEVFDPNECSQNSS